MMIKFRTIVCSMNFRHIHSLSAVLVLAFASHCACGFNVTDMSPKPATTVTTSPNNITITLSSPAAAGTVSASTVRLVRAGADGVLGTADDVTVTPAGISTNGNQILIDLTGVILRTISIK